jgi:hypothetical protein
MKVLWRELEFFFAVQGVGQGAARGGKLLSQTHLSAQKARPLRNFVCFLDAVALRKICSTYDCFPVLTGHTVISDKGLSSTNFCHAPLYFQYL